MPHSTLRRSTVPCIAVARSAAVLALVALLPHAAHGLARPHTAVSDSSRRSTDSTRAASRQLADGTTVTPRGDEAPPALSWREQLAGRGVTFEVNHITDASGGSRALVDAGSVRTYGNAGVTLQLDSLLPVHGLRVFAQYAAKSGRNLSAEAAMMQNFSNIDAADFHSIGELWAEQRLFGERLRLKAGRLDFNKEFAGTLMGGSFLNSSMGYSPSITAAPTYPLPSPGANVIVRPTSSLSVGAGVFSGIDGAAAAPGEKSLFEIAQATQRWTLPGRALAGQLGAGGWKHTGLFPAIDAPDDASRAVSHIHGWFATLDQELWHGAVHAGHETAAPPTIAMFAQAGRADPRARSIYTHAGGGLTFSGLLPSRGQDVLGVGSTRASSRDGRELVEEVFYLLPVTSHLALEADVQRVARREWGGNALRGGTVSTLRTTIHF